MRSNEMSLRRRSRRQTSRRRCAAGAALAALTALPMMLPAAPASAESPQEPVVFSHDDEVVRGEGFMVLADRRLFAVMAFLNAMGYDDEAEGVDMHPARLRVRQAVAARLAEDPQRVAGWKAWYDSRQVAWWHFQDHALAFNDDFPFRRVRPDEELTYPQTAELLADLPQVINDFWRVAGLEEIWEEVKPLYREELALYDFDRMQAELTGLWRYLRMPRQDPFILVNVPNLIDAHYHGIGAQYGDYYYTVESPGAGNHALNAHEYLHSIVNPLMQQHYPAAADQRKLQRYFESGRDGAMAASYGSPVSMAQESLVRALDHRLRVIRDGSAANVARVEARIRELTEGGLAFTGPFYALLADAYETDRRPFDAWVPLLLERLPPVGLIGTAYD